MSFAWVATIGIGVPLLFILAMVFHNRLPRIRVDTSLLLLYAVALAPAVRQIASPESTEIVDQYGNVNVLTPALTGTAQQISQVLTILVWILVVAVLMEAILRRSEADRERHIRWLVVAAISFVLTRLAASIFGYGGGFTDLLRTIGLDALVLLALTRRRWTWESMRRHSLWILRVYTYGSLLLMVLDESKYTLNIQNRLFLGYDQLAGLTPHPNVMAPIAAAALVLELSRRSRWRWVSWIVPLACVLFSQSRTGEGAAIIGVAVLVLARTPGRAPRLWPWAVVGLATAVAASLGIVRPDLYSALSASILGDGNASLDGRTSIWGVALQVWRDHPLFGYGPTVFGVAYRSINVSYGAGQAHGQLLQTLAEGGLVEAVALTVLIVSLAVYAWRSRHRKVLLALLAVLLVHGVAESPLRGGLTAQNTLFVVLLLLTLAGSRSEVAEEQALELADVEPRGVQQVRAGRP